MRCSRLLLRPSRIPSARCHEPLAQPWSATGERRRIVTVKLLDAKEAGDLLGIPHTWLLAQARQDKVPHVRLGKYVRFDPADLEAWLPTHKRGPRPNA